MTDKRAGNENVLLSLTSPSHPDKLSINGKEVLEGLEGKTNTITMKNSVCFSR